MKDIFCLLNHIKNTLLFGKSHVSSNISTGLWLKVNFQLGNPFNTKTYRHITLSQVYSPVNMKHYCSDPWGNLLSIAVRGKEATAEWNDTELLVMYCFTRDKQQPIRPGMQIDCD